MSTEGDVSRQHPIVTDFEREENGRAFLYDWVEVILKLFNSGREMYAKQIFALLYAEIFGRNGKWDLLKDVPACIRCIRETRNKSLQKNGFRKPFFLFKKQVQRWYQMCTK